MMERGRGRGRATKKRGSLPSHSHFHDSPSSLSTHQSHTPLPNPDPASPSTPAPSVAAAAVFQQRVPNTAPLRGAKSRPSHSTHNGQRTTSPTSDSAFRITPRTDRPARSATFTPSFTFDSPSGTSSTMAGVGPSARKRARTFETSLDGTAADDEGHSKGGHSLRKRTRIDYTQEQIDDDLVASAARSEMAGKSTSTPSARGRKKKQLHEGLDEEHEDFNSATGTQKRRRAEKSPAPTRGGSSRRRLQSRKSTAEISTFHVDQPSDNEVQDTILVGVSMDGPEDSEEVTSANSDSFSESESRPSSSDGSDGGLAQAEPEPATPQPQVLPQVEQAVSLAPESDGAIEKDMVEDATSDKTDVAPKDISLPLPPKEPEQPNVSHEAEQTEQEPAHTEVAEPAPKEEPESAEEARAVTDVPEIEREREPQQKVEMPQPELEQPGSRYVVQPEIQTTQLIPTVESNSKITCFKEQSSPPASQVDSVPAPSRRDSVDAATRRRTMRPQRSTEPTRLKQLERIYQTPTPFGCELGLTPYENEDIPHPGPFTEWIHPDKGKLEATPIPTPAPTPSPVESAPVELAWDYRRPLKSGQFIKLYEQEKKRWWPKPFPSMATYYNECIQKYNDYKRQAEIESSRDSGSNASSQSAAEVMVTRLYGETSASRQAPYPDPLAAPSPLPMDEDEPQAEADADGGEEEQEIDEGEENTKSGAGEPIEVTRNPPKQWLFPKLRDPQEFVDALDGYQTMETSKLYQTAAAAAEYMHNIQMEWNELKKVTDDEENAKRRLANDKTIVNWENRQKADEPAPWRRHFDDAIKGPPVFEVRGARAPKPYIDDPILEHQREEDKIMAQAYGFKHNSHPTQVGRQNPEDQRWEMADNRLRERKKTEKGAELTEQNVVEGKRVRKPRYFSDQSKEPSRSGTPVGITALGSGRRGGRRKVFGGLNGEDGDGTENTQTAEAVPEAATRRRRGGFRGRPHIPTEEDPAPSTQPENNQSDDEYEDKPGSARKRGRAPVFQAPVTAPTENDDPKHKRQRNSKNAEIASSSFYSNQSVDSRPESRPSTASSAATVNTEETAESSYSLREKRKRNFALENDPELEPRQPKRTRGVVLPKFEGLEPKKRGPRRKTATSQPAPLPRPPAEPAPAAVPMPAMALSTAPQPVGGLKAPTLIFSHPPPALAPAPPGPYLHTFNAAPAFPPGGNPPPPAAPPAIKKPITKIKLTNYGASSQGPSRAGTPANIAPNPRGTGKGGRGGKAESGLAKPIGLNGNNGLDDKPYAEMSKSEKMSWSMRRRWASGEMQGAVEKRRTTLANKKAEKAAGTPVNGSDSGAPGNNTDTGSAGASASGTPTPVPMPNVSGLAMPGQTQPMQLQPHGLVPPHSVSGYAYPPARPAL